jgi:DnaJ-class molecular chaperone
VSDEIVCPDCQGTGSRRYGSDNEAIELVCLFCSGLGVVGGSNEPAEEHASEPPADGHPVWKDPATKGLTCRMCLGTRRVVNLSAAGNKTGKVIEMPCPGCSG